MKGNYTLTTELKRLFNNIKQDLIKEFPNDKILIEYFLMSVLHDESSVAYQILERVTLSETISILQKTLHSFLLANTHQLNTEKQPLFDNVYDEYIQEIAKTNENVDSGLLLIKILKNNNEVNKTFRGIGISSEQLEKCYNEQFPKVTKGEEEPIKSKKEKRISTDFTRLMKPTSTVNINNDVEKNLLNINKIAESGHIDCVIGNNTIYEQIFRIFNKQKKNNVVLVGDSGVGKTCIVENIANLIINGNVPLSLKDKVLMKMNFSDLLSGSAIRGMLETKIKAILNDAKKDGRYIIFIDDIHLLLDDHNKVSEVDIASILDSFLSEPNIMFICTTNHKSYNKCISKHNLLKRRLVKVVVNELSSTEIQQIISYKVGLLEDYHNVKFTSECVKSAIALSQRYITDILAPDSIIDVLDESASLINNTRTENIQLKEMRNELNNIVNEKNALNLNTTDVSILEKYDILCKKEISLKSKINVFEKNEQSKKEILEINEDIIKHVISDKINVPITQLAEDDKTKLKNLDEKLKQIVIGQDEAIDNVCRVVKRQRIGISDPTKPPVLLFAGSTGTGKTYLAKQLSKELFGDEKHLVRLDMSEYIDKTSTNKLIGAGSGYVGYENGGVLTEAIKKHKHCVLLLDEIEKANEDVHNVFLQLFDEGRLTDNTGEIVDFRHCIIIMTSNVGAKESDERGNGIGFNQNINFSNEIINKCLKKAFKPEFINRINSIVYFNKLTDNDYRVIITNEINKIVERIKVLGYNVDETITNTKLPQYLLERVKTMRQYGARPIVRELQKILEDSITDYIIDNNPTNGFVFSFSDLKV